jgi:hypothetical protein
MGGSPSVQAAKAPDTAAEYQQSLNTYINRAPQLYGEESTYQPLYNQMQQGIMGSNIDFYSRAIEGQMPGAQAALQGTQNMAIANAMQQYGQYAGGISQATLAANPQLQQLQTLAQGQITAGSSADPTLSGLLATTQQQTPGQVQQLQDLATRAGTMFDPTNQQLQGLSNQVGGLTGQAVGQIQGIAGQAAADTRSDIFNQTKGAVMGQLGNLDPVTQQLSDMAQQQLSLGGQVSQQGLQDAAQAARAAYSSRGMLNSTGSIAAEVLNRDAVQQARLQQRQQFASGVAGLVGTETQQRTANAMGLTQADIAATQANQGLAGSLYTAAGQLGQTGAQVQGGLQGQIAQNLSAAQQAQAGLTQAAIQTQQTGTQQAAGLQGSILDQMYRMQQAGAQGLGNIYQATSAAQGTILGAAAGGAQLAGSMGGSVPTYGTGSPNLFQGSGILQLTAQNQTAQMNANQAASQMNAQSAGASKGAMIGAGAGIASAAIMGIALM